MTPEFIYAASFVLLLSFIQAPLETVAIISIGLGLGATLYLF